MLKATLNSSLRLIHTKNLFSDVDELSVVDCRMWHCGIPHHVCFKECRTVISGFLQLLWMLYCSCILLCLCCNINKVIKSFCFVLFNVYFYSLSTAPLYRRTAPLRSSPLIYSQRAAPSQAQNLLFT